jgi:integrase
VGIVVTNVLPDGATMHSLRHRFASRAYRGTRNLRAVQVLLGHASIATTERYTAVDDSEIRAAIGGWCWRLLNIAATVPGLRAAPRTEDRVLATTKATI